MLAGTACVPPLPPKAEATASASGEISTTSGTLNETSSSDSALDSTSEGSAASSGVMTTGPGNQAPQPQPDDYVIMQDASLNVAAPGVLGNDADPDGDALVIVGTGESTWEAEVVIGPDGELLYNAPPGYWGVDEVTYEVADGNGGQAEATVQVFVNPTTIHVATITSGFGGVVFYGQTPGDEAGQGVGLGDINMDGLADVMIGAQRYNGDDGRGYVIFGGDQLAQPADIALADVGAGGTVSGFVIESAEGTQAGLGWLIMDIGDVDGDDHNDIAASAQDFNGPSPGAVHIVFGKEDQAPVDLGAPGSGGFTIEGEGSADQFGVSVSPVGDLNMDGHDDILIGGYLANPSGNEDAGRAYLVWGKDDSSPVLPGGYGAVFDGAAAGDLAGIVASGRDVGGSSHNDLVIGAEFANAVGRVFVYFGRSDPPPPPASILLDADQFEMTGSGFAITGDPSEGEDFGYWVTLVDDMNDDGRAEVLACDRAADYGMGNRGACYVVFGKDDSGEVQLDQLGSSGFRIVGEQAGDALGERAISVGDINGDGRGDFTVVALDHAGITGKVYVVYGKADSNPVNLSVIASGIGGFSIVGDEPYAALGWGIAGGGDVDGDGCDDLLIGVPRSFDPMPMLGRVFLLHGFPLSP